MVQMSPLLESKFTKRLEITNLGRFRALQQPKNTNSKRWRSKAREATQQWRKKRVLRIWLASANSSQSCWSSTRGDSSLTRTLIPIWRMIWRRLSLLILRSSPKWVARIRVCSGLIRVFSKRPGLFPKYAGPSNLKVTRSQFHKWTTFTTQTS